MGQVRGGEAWGGEREKKSGGRSKGERCSAARARGGAYLRVHERKVDELREDGELLVHPTDVRIPDDIIEGVGLVVSERLTITEDGRSSSDGAASRLDGVLGLRLCG